MKQISNLSNQGMPIDQIIVRFFLTIEDFPVDQFNSALEEKKIPVTYGDVTDDLSKGVTILSGDVIMMELAKIYNPQLTVFVMDYPGVLEGNPKSPESKVIPLVDSDVR